MHSLIQKDNRLQVRMFSYGILVLFACVSLDLFWVSGIPTANMTLRI